MSKNKFSLEVLNPEGVEVKKKHTRVGMHTMSQFYANPKQLRIFSEEQVEEFSKATGLSIKNKIDGYGIALNQAQNRVFEGILKAFSDTNYKGEEEIDKLTSLKEIISVGSGRAKEVINKPYENIDKIPILKLTQAEIIELSGYDLKAQKQSDKQHVTDALHFLATNQFCFYWSRTKKDKKGIFLKDKKGNYLKEEVSEVGTLLRIKVVRDPKTGKLDYYEIHPSAVLLDQVNDHFLLIPNDWRDQVKQITDKKDSKYTYAFLRWLRLQYEQIRRYNKGGGKNRPQKPFKISKDWEEIAITLKIPKSIYISNRKTGMKIIQEAYSVALKLGYLLKVENNGVTDILYLNEGYYPKPGELV